MRKIRCRIRPEDRRFFRALHLRQPAEHHRDRQHAADALAQKRRPRNARNAHLKRRDEQNVHKNVGQRRTRQKPERRLRVAEGGKNTRRYIIKEHERQPQHVNSQVQRRIFENIFRV